jgi:hypothetical protein
MSNTKEYQEYNLNIIINKKLKHSYISIDKSKKITIKTPYSSNSFIHSLLDEKRAWIEKQFLKLENITLIGNKELFSLEYIQEQTLFYAKEMQLEYTKLKFRKMKSSWGNCNSKREITLNRQLSLLQKKELIHYVIVHELAHITHMNHSKDFHTLVEKYLPNSKAYRKELKSIRLT